jgi:hypothetical protein
VKRTDQIKDMTRLDDIDTEIIFYPSKYDFIWVVEDKLTRHDATRQDGEIEYQAVGMKHNDAVGIALKNEYIEKGAERCTYELVEVDSAGQPCGQRLVGKVSAYEETDPHQFHIDCAKTQMTAKRIANKMNEIISLLNMELPRVEFLQCSTYQWRNPGGKIDAILAEKRINVQSYKKFNDNKGGVDTVFKAPDEGLKETDFDMNIIKEDEEEDDSMDDTESDDSEDEDATFDASELVCVDEDVPQAFSHWSYQYTNGDTIVVDLQGVLTSSGSAFQLTDPAIHSTPKKYGKTDRGREGMRDFIGSHICNNLCKVLRLREDFSRKSRRTWKRSNSWRTVNR